MVAAIPPCEGRLTADKKGPIPLPDDDDSMFILPFLISHDDSHGCFQVLIPSKWRPTHWIPSRRNCPLNCHGNKPETWFNAHIIPSLRCKNRWIFIFYFFPVNISILFCVLSFRLMYKKNHLLITHGAEFSLLNSSASIWHLSNVLLLLVGVQCWANERTNDRRRREEEEKRREARRLECQSLSLKFTCWLRFAFLVLVLRFDGVQHIENGTCRRW